MIEVTVATRTFFNNALAAHCNGDRLAAERASPEVFVMALRNIGPIEDARKFLGGHLHWLRGKSPIELEEARKIAKANIAWCFGEQISPEKVAMWTAVLAEDLKPSICTGSPQEAHASASTFKAKVAEGRDPSAELKQVRKVLAKKKKVK